MAIPHLKDKLQEAIPLSFDGRTLEIAIDAEHGRNDIRILEKDHLALENCLRRLVSTKDAKLSIIRRNEVLSPHETAPLHSRDIRGLKEKAAKNEFVKEVMKAFNGKIIDVWGG